MRTFWTSIYIVAILCGSAASDLTINTSIKAGSPTTPDQAPFGTGDIGSIVRAAADVWESLIQDNVTVNIEYEWFEHPVATGLGRTNLGVNPPLISFDTDTLWFLDSTPADHSEYDPMQTDMAGALSTGKYFAATPGVAFSGFDLFSVALHELGTCWPVERSPLRG